MSDYDHSDPNYDPNLDPSYTQPMRSRDVGNYGQGSDAQRGRSAAGTMTNLVDRLVATGEMLQRVDARLVHIIHLLSGNEGPAQATGHGLKQGLSPVGILSAGHEEINHISKQLEEIEMKLGTLHGLIGN